ncbi:MAG: hypothetical protein ABIO78_01280 [Thermoanaerobaculia bacterium]
MFHDISELATTEPALGGTGVWPVTLDGRPAVRWARAAYSPSVVSLP